ncbi:MAG: type II toxin-antitoxin system HicA family toxin [Pelodictyon phaeoclathratiforme]
MSELPRLSGRELLKALGKVGFVLKRQHGSHMILRRDEPWAQTVIPDHKELDRGTLRAILRQAEVSVQQLNQLLME